MVLAEQQERLIEADDYFEIAALPENDEKRLELEEGMIIEMAGSRPINTITALRIGTFINVFVMENNLGYVTGADGAFQLAPRLVRIPDVAFVAKARIPEGIPARFKLAPDLAIELVSEDEDVFKKAREYLRAGSKMVWLVYADEKTVSVITVVSENELRAREFGVNDTLDGGDALPGFSLPVRTLFPD